MSVLDCHDGARKELAVEAHIPRSAAEQPAALRAFDPAFGL
jgi:hypothetical protein